MADCLDSHPSTNPWFQAGEEVPKQPPAPEILGNNLKDFRGLIVFAHLSPKGFAVHTPRCTVHTQSIGRKTKCKTKQNKTKATRTAVKC